MTIFMVMRCSGTRFFWQSGANDEARVSRSGSKTASSWSSWFALASSWSSSSWSRSRVRARTGVSSTPLSGSSLRRFGREVDELRALYGAGAGVVANVERGVVVVGLVLRGHELPLFVRVCVPSDFPFKPPREFRGASVARLASPFSDRRRVARHLSSVIVVSVERRGAICLSVQQISIAIVVVVVVLIRVRIACIRSSTKPDAHSATHARRDALRGWWLARALVCLRASDMTRLFARRSFVCALVVAVVARHAHQQTAHRLCRRAAATAHRSAHNVQNALARCVSRRV